MQQVWPPLRGIVGLQSNIVTVPKLITNKLDSLLVRCDTCGVVQERGTIQQYMASHQQTSVVAAASIEQLKQRIDDLERAAPAVKEEKTASGNCPRVLWLRSSWPGPRLAIATGIGTQ